MHSFPPLRTAPRAKRIGLAMSVGFLLLTVAATLAWAEDDEPPHPFSARYYRAWGAHLGDGDLLWSLGGGAAAALAVVPADDEIVDWFVEHEPLGPDGRDIGYWLGHRVRVAASVGIIVGAGLVSGQDEWTDTGWILLQSQLATAGITEIIKRSSNRLRPDGSNDKSLPSGHAVGAFTTATVLAQRHGWWIGAPAYAAAVYTGLSRLQGDKHHLSDVLLGFGLSYWISSAAVRAAGARENDDDEAHALLSMGPLRLIPAPLPGDDGLPLLRMRW